MRVAVIADIHGNLLALEAVLAEVEAASPDLLIELGDAVSGPLQPAECFERLAALDAVLIRGNHDRWVAADSAEGLSPVDTFTWERLSLAQRAALMARPMVWRDAGILAMHALTTDDNTYLLHEATPQGVRERRPPEIAALLPPASGETLVLTAHTHRLGTVTLPDGRLVVNPGAVGLPAYRDTEPHPHVMEAGSPHARWALLEWRRGQWHVEHRAVPYDWAAASAEALRNGAPRWAHAIAHGILE